MLFKYLCWLFILIIKIIQCYYFDDDFPQEQPKFQVDSPIEPFLERQIEEDIVTFLHASDPLPVVIVGSNGVGKSEFAKKYAESYLDDNEDMNKIVVWIKCGTLLDMAKSFYELSVEFNIEVLSRSHTFLLIMGVTQYFFNKKALFILDDANPKDENIKELLSYCENSETIKFLITSKYRNWDEEKFNILTLDHFQTGQITDMMKKLKRLMTVSLLAKLAFRNNPEMTNFINKMTNNENNMENNDNTEDEY